MSYKRDHGLATRITPCCLPCYSPQTKTFKGTTQDPNKFVQLPLQSAVHREIARYALALVR